MLFSLPRKRGINIAKIRGNKVTDYKSTYPMDTIRKMHGLTMKIAVFMDRYAKQPTFYVEPEKWHSFSGT